MRHLWLVGIGLIFYGALADYLRDRPLALLGVFVGLCLVLFNPRRRTTEGFRK